MSQFSGSELTSKQQTELIYTHSDIVQPKNHDPNLYLHTEIFLVRREDFKCAYFAKSLSDYITI